MMKNFSCRASVVSFMGLLMLGSVSSCVDNAYDLSKDIDGEIELGGNRFTIPTSSTDTFSMRRILDLEENSTIVAVGEENRYGLRKGDYVLEQEGQDAGEPTQVQVDEVSVKEDEITVTEADTRLEFDERTSALLPDGVNLVEKVENLKASFNMESFDVDPALKEVHHGKVDCKVEFMFWFVNDNNIKYLTLKEGFEAKFDDQLTITTDDSRIEIIDHCLVRVKKDIRLSVDQTLSPIRLTIASIDFEGYEGQGIIEPGYFRLSSDIIANGDVLLDKNALPASGNAVLDLHMRSNVTSLLVHEVTGIVDPQINVDIAPVEVTDIPDFLKENDVELDLANPQLMFTVNNELPVDITFNATMVAIKDGVEKANVGLGERYGTDPIVLKGEGETVVCLVRPGNTAPEGETVEVPGLETLLSCIPDEIRIDMEDDDVRVVQTPVTVTLGKSYSVATEYHFAAPLSFGPDMHLTYTETMDGWDADLEDISAKKIEATLDVENTIPIEMTLEAEAIDKDGQVMENIDVEVQGSIQGGTIEEPATSPIVITITCKDGKLDGIDGMNLVFRGNTPLSHERQNLNEKQAIKMLNIKVSVIGGVIVTL